MTPEQMQEVRNKLGLSQPRMAFVMHTTSTTISRWECGEVKPPPLVIVIYQQLKKRHGWIKTNSLPDIDDDTNPAEYLMGLLGVI